MYQQFCQSHVRKYRKQGDLDDAQETTSELILEIIKSNNSLSFFNNSEKEIISFFVKILICFISSRLF